MYELPKKLVPRFFNNTARTYDAIVLWLTFGKDRYWKKEIIQKISHGESFLDLACGTGILTRKIAEKFPMAKIVGVDITPSYLEMARRNSMSYHNISFIHQDAEKLNLDTKFDCITSSYMPKYCDPKILVATCINHLKPKGTIILHDFTFPQNYFIQRFWNLYFILLNFIGTFIPSWKDAFVELPKLIKSSTWVKSYIKEMKRHGLDVKCQYLTLHSSAIITGRMSND